MKEPLFISSKDNPSFKRALSLYDRKDRNKTGLFIIEGYRETLRAQESGVQFEEFFFCPELFLGENEYQLLEKSSTRLIRTTKALFEKLSYRDRPDGLIAVAKKMNKTLSEITFTTNHPLVVIAEAIEKPGNLGTILRSSDAAHADLVLVVNGCTDIYNPNVVRASVGTLFTIPVVEATNEEALSFLTSNKIQLIAATPEATTLYTNISMKGPLGIVLGTEQLGLTPFWKQACHHMAKIPMEGVADSLNVAMAATIFLFEASRQRREHTL